jgi:hypothetical protein
MIKIIYGVTKTSSDCGLIYPPQDDMGLLNLVKQSIIKNTVSENTVGNYVYAINCVNDFYVFSKINIVYDKGKRVSYRAFMVAVESHETSYDVLEEIDKLERQYTDCDNIQQSSMSKSIKSIKTNKSTTQKQIVAAYYSDDKELNKYLCIKDNYKKYEAIYFIDKENENKAENPINALKKYDEIVSITNLEDEVKKPEPEPEPQPENKTILKIIKNPILTLLFGLLIGIAGFWGYQNLPSNKKWDDAIAVSGNLYDSITNKNYEIAELRNRIKTLESPPIDTTEELGESEKLEESITNKPLIVVDRKQLENEVDSFLKTGSKTMTLDEIDAKIKEYNKTSIDSNTKYKLTIFFDFLEILKGNPVKKSDLDKFKSKYLDTNKLNGKYEYVKFFIYLKDKDNTFLSEKNLDGLTDKTLQEIENHYGYIK